MTKYEIEVKGKAQLKDVSKMIENIRKVNEQVEKANDKYKSIMEQVYLLKKYRVHRQDDCKLSFAAFITEKTGMSSSMAFRLCQIYQMQVDMWSSTFADAKVRITSEEFFGKLSIRDLLLFTQHESELAELYAQHINQWGGIEEDAMLEIFELFKESLKTLTLEEKTDEEADVSSEPEETDTSSEPEETDTSNEPEDEKSGWDCDNLEDVEKFMKWVVDGGVAFPFTINIER